MKTRWLTLLKRLPKRKLKRLNNYNKNVKSSLTVTNSNKSSLASLRTITCWNFSNNNKRSNKRSKINVNKKAPCIPRIRKICLIWLTKMRIRKKTTSLNLKSSRPSAFLRPNRPSNSKRKKAMILTLSWKKWASKRKHKKRKKRKNKRNKRINLNPKNKQTNKIIKRKSLHNKKRKLLLPTPKSSYKKLWRRKPRPRKPQRKISSPILSNKCKSVRMLWRRKLNKCIKLMSNISDLYASFLASEYLPNPILYILYSFKSYHIF